MNINMPLTPTFLPVFGLPESSRISTKDDSTLMLPHISESYWETKLRYPVATLLNVHKATMRSQPLSEKPLKEKDGGHGAKMQAARVLQRFFLTCVQAVVVRKRVLRLRLNAIRQQKHAELDCIAELKERKKIELRLEVGMASRGELAVEIHHSEQVLQESRIMMDALTADLKVLKKENAFLQKRCKALQRKNKQLKLERKQESQLKKTAARDSKRIRECKVILSHYQDRVSEEKSRLETAENRLQSCRGRNRRLRQLMGSMVQMVEERETEHADKWDLIDLLYQIQRGPQKERRSFDTPIVVSWSRSHTKVPTSREMEPLLADCSMKKQHPGAHDPCRLLVASASQ
jgi:hypothetical protein